MTRADTTAAASAAATILEQVLSRPPTLDHGRLVCLDGPAGSGKSTLAAHLRRAARSAGLSVSLVHLDNLYAGWDGLDSVGSAVHRLLLPLADGSPGRYRRYDWTSGAFAEERTVHPCDLLVVEGVGAGHPAYDDLVTLLVWAWAPGPLRLERSVSRDGEASRANLVRWQASEDALHARERTRERADLVYDGVSGGVTGPSG